MMANVGDRLKQAFSGWEAWFLTSDRSLPGQLHLRETRKTVLHNGPLECRFFRFELVAGGYRARAKAS
jgi:putative N6-adenine-specific DNA methylase